MMSYAYPISTIHFVMYYNQTVKRIFRSINNFLFDLIFSFSLPSFGFYLLQCYDEVLIIDFHKFSFDFFDLLVG